MNGFIGIYGDGDLLTHDSADTRRFHSLDLSIIQRIPKKFTEDTVLIDNEHFVFIIDGVILNDCELFIKYNQQDLTSLVEYFVSSQVKDFFSLFRGSFSGIFYDKQDRQCLLFVDHTGSKKIFYTQVDSKLLFSTDFKELTKLLPREKRSTFDKEFLYSFLTYSYSPNHHTILEHVYEIPAGHYLKINQKTIQLAQYHKFTNIPNKNTLSENIEIVDRLFRQAIQRVIRKNEKYNLETCASLSAGLDSRMVTWIANQISHSQIINVTFSQKEYFDENIPREISNFLGTRWYFQALNEGDYLCNIDESIKKSQGLIHYSCPAQILYGYKNIDFDNIGIVLTGAYGGSILYSSFSRKEYSQKPVFGDNAYSRKLLSRLKDVLSKDFIKDYQNKEIYSLYNLGFSCENLGAQIAFQPNTEAYSPFCDADFLEFALSIPLDQRWSHSLYDSWILKKYPDAAKWKHNGVREIGKKERVISVVNRKIPLHDVPKRVTQFILKKTHLYNFDKILKNHSMNPYDYWFDVNKKLTTQLDTYFKENIGRLNNYAEIQKDATVLYQSGTAMEKLQTITLLAIMNYATSSDS
ncbi:MAG: hypothetical protein K5860_05970 [Bacteroidales bacterium]|nr:hypothetical protein [Bacteroidales bacterium]